MEYATFFSLPETVQAEIRKLIGHFYEPDDGTPMEELAACAFMLGANYKEKR